jgi:hypothetical protein
MIVRSVLVELRSQGVTEAFWTVGPASRPPGLAEALLAVGANVDSSVDICAYRLSDEWPAPPADDDVTVRAMTTRDSPDRPGVRGCHVIWHRLTHPLTTGTAP